MNTLLTALGVQSVGVVERDTGRAVVEKVPLEVMIKLGILHNTWLGALVVRSSMLRWYLKQLTINKGLEYDSPQSKEQIPHFIASYSVDISTLDRPVEDFKTLNEFFYRRHRAGARPVACLQDDKILTQPCDCRLLVFDHVSIAKKLWIKGRQFSVKQLLGEVYNPLWEECSIVLSRLAPQDHHRYYMPCRGRIKRVCDTDGEFYSVKPIVVNSSLDVFGHNRRMVVEFDGTPAGPMAMVIIGAAEVGSIVMDHQPGAVLGKGQEVGYFAYGGSTVMTLFASNAVRFDDDLLTRSNSKIETLVNVGSRLARTS